MPSITLFDILSDVPNVHGNVFEYKGKAEILRTGEHIYNFVSNTGFEFQLFAGGEFANYMDTLNVGDRFERKQNQ